MKTFYNTYIKSSNKSFKIYSLFPVVSTQLQRKLIRCLHAVITVICTYVDFGAQSKLTLIGLDNPYRDITHCDVTS